MSERVLRFDHGELRSPRRTGQGRLRVDGVFTRTGIFTYLNADGSKRRELRSPEEVDASLASLEVLPVVEDHPAAGVVGADATKARGWTLEGVRRDGDLVTGSLIITDPALVRAVEGGKRALSVGYEVDYDATPGTHPVYGSYDGVQRKIRGDHLAIVDAGRAGPAAQIRMDSRAEVQPHATSVPNPLTGAPASVTTYGAKMTEAEIKIMQEALALATKRADGAESELAVAKAKLDAAQGRCDSLEVETAKLRTASGAATELTETKAKLEDALIEAKAQRARADHAENPARLAAAATERSRILDAAKEVLKKDFRADHGNHEIMITVVERVEGKLDAEKAKSEAYVAARFDSCVAAYRAGEAALVAASRAARNDASNASAADRSSAREKMIARNLGPSRTA